MLSEPIQVNCTFSIGSINSPLSLSITPSLFHSRLKTLIPFPLILPDVGLAFVFTARCYASAVGPTSHGPVSVCPCPCPCPCPCLSQVGVLLKQQNIGSRKQHHTIPQGYSFLTPKISAKFVRGHPVRGHQMQVGWVKIGDFQEITGYISKTVQDRRMVSIKVE